MEKKNYYENTKINIQSLKNKKSNVLTKFIIKDLIKDMLDNSELGFFRFEHLVEFKENEKTYYVHGLLLNKDSYKDVRQNEIDIEISILEDKDNYDQDGNAVLDEEGNITQALFPADIGNKKITLNLQRIIDIDSGKIINNVKQIEIEVLSLLEKIYFVARNKTIRTINRNITEVF